MPWFPRDRYDQFRASLKDTEHYPADYDTWIHLCEATEREWIESGATVLRVSVNPEAFLKWCKRRYAKPNRRAVEVFIEEILSRSSI